MKIRERFQNKYYVNFLITILVSATLLALTLNMEIVGVDVVDTPVDGALDTALDTAIKTTNSAFINLLEQLDYSFQGYNLIWLIIIPNLFNYYKIAFFLNKKSRGIRVPAALFSFFMVFGKSFELAGSWDLVFANSAQVIKSVIAGIGFYALFYCIIHYIFDFFEKRKGILRDKKFNTIKVTLLEKRPFLTSFLIILIMWLPYVIAHFPGIFMFDTGMQILQVFNIEDSTSEYLNLISEEVKLNNHHPVVHTVIMGGCIKFGQYLFQSENIGYFIYTLLQMLISAGSIAYSIKFMTKKYVPYWFRTVTLIYFSIIPAFVNWAILGTKDTLFSCMMLLFLVFLLEMIENAEIVLQNIRKVNLLFFILVAVILLRNNGIYVILIALSLLALIHKRQFKQVVLIAAGIFITYYGFNHVLLPSLQITGGSVREALSVPFQQTARYARDYGHKVTEEEKKAINKVLNYDFLVGKYDPNLSDPVKRLFNENSDREDLNIYFKAWFQMFLKHPEVYVQATMNNVYGYFYYSEEATPIYTWTWSQKCMEDVNKKAGLEFQLNDSLEPMRVFFQEYDAIYKKIPGLSIFHSCAIYTWVLILGIAFIVRIKDYRYLVGYAPLIVLLLFCIVSPSNGNRYFRYSYPIAYCLPVVVGIQLSRFNNSDKLIL